MQQLLGEIHAYGCKGFGSLCIVKTVLSINTLICLIIFRKQSSCIQICLQNGLVFSRFIQPPDFFNQIMSDHYIEIHDSNVGRIHRSARRVTHTVSETVRRIIGLLATAHIEFSGNGSHELDGFEFTAAVLSITPGLVLTQTATAPGVLHACLDQHDIRGLLRTGRQRHVSPIPPSATPRDKNGSHRRHLLCPPHSRCRARTTR